MVVNVKIIIKELNVSVIVHLVFSVEGFTESNKSLTQTTWQHQATLQWRPCHTGRGLKKKKDHVLLKAINALQDAPQRMKALVEYMDMQKEILQLQKEKEVLQKENQLLQRGLLQVQGLLTCCPACL